MQFLEATVPPSRVPKPPAQTVKSVADTIGDLPDDPEGVGEELGVNPDLLAVHIDRNINPRVWNGTTFEDRLHRAITSTKRNLVDELEKSLLAQETYADVEKRLLGRLGVGPMEADTGGAAMRSLDTFLDTEVRLAWSEGLAAVNQQEDTVIVWNTTLDEATTPGCWNNHGRTQEELGDDWIMPRHWRCRCEPMTVPNPDSPNADWAAQGQAIIDEMVQEREQGWADMQEAWYPPPRPSRLAGLREAAEEDGQWQKVAAVESPSTARGAPSKFSRMQKQPQFSWPASVRA